MRVAISATLLLTLAAPPAWCQPAQPAAPPPAPVHHHRRIHHHKHLAMRPPAPPTMPVASRADPNALAPAPVPNVDAAPPQKELPPNQASLDPGNLQLHYPDIGNGYLPNSSSDHGDNERAPIVPGMSVVVPLTQTPPPLPPAHPSPP